ncbi:MAG TPA: helix-turn-helix transcriptional regulator [Mobilitalea sp.]|nr:helix-turn-helix transcriptional regulator [Mobilitalea sp.]
MISKENIQTFYEAYRILIKEDDYIYLLPHPALKSWISNYTITFPIKGMMSNEYTIMPHGSATLVLSSDGNKTFCTLFGPMTKPICVGSEANQFSLLFIVEFQPAGYYAFSGMPQKELTNCTYSFDNVNPVMNSLMAQHLESAPDIRSFVSEIDKLFLAHLKNIFYRPEFSIANQIILNSGGQTPVRELSDSVFYSERHLGRIFEEYLGVCIKPFSRLVRINKAIQLLRRPQYSITQAYLQTGFYDMSHFIHEFNSVCGITPQKYQDNMSDFYNEIAKF